MVIHGPYVDMYGPYVTIYRHVWSIYDHICPYMFQVGWVMCGGVGWDASVNGAGCVDEEWVGMSSR